MAFSAALALGAASAVPSGIVPAAGASSTFLTLCAAQRPPQSKKNPAEGQDGSKKVNDDNEGTSSVTFNIYAHRFAPQTAD